jgi:hypothetical protein
LRALFLLLAACGTPTFELDIGSSTIDVVWILETEELEAIVLEREAAAVFARTVDADARATVLSYDRALSRHQLDPGPLPLVDPSLRSRTLPAPDGIRVFDPDRAEWVESELPDSVASLRIAPFDHAACAAMGCLDGAADECVVPCPAPTPPSPPDRASPPGPIGIVPDLPVRLDCGAEVQWHGAGACAPIDECPPGGVRTDLPPGAIVILPGEPLFQRLVDALPGATVALGSGHYAEEVLVPPGVLLTGACTASTSVAIVHLATDAAVEHLSTTVALVVNPGTTGAFARDVAATSATTAIDIVGDATIERAVVRGRGYTGVAVTGSATIRDVVVEGFRNGLSVAGHLVGERIAVRDPVQHGLLVPTGEASLSALSIEGGRYGVAVATASADLEGLAIAGAVTAIDAHTSSVTVRGLRVTGASRSSAVRARADLRLADVDWTSAVPETLPDFEIFEGARLSVDRARFTSSAVSVVHTSARGGDVTLADVVFVGAAIIMGGGHVTADRIEVTGGPDKNCISLESLATAILRDVTIRGECPAGGIFALGSVTGHRIDVDGLLEGGISVIGGLGAAIAPAITLTSVSIRDTPVGVKTQRRVRSFVLERASFAGVDVGLRVERSSEVSAVDLRIDPPNRIGIDVDSSALADVSRFALLGSGRTGVVLRGTVQPDGPIELVPRRGVVLRDGRIGRYERGADVYAFGFDPGDLLQRVTYEAVETIVIEE